MNTETPALSTIRNDYVPNLSAVWIPNQQKEESLPKIVECEYCKTNQFLKDTLSCKSCGANLPLEPKCETHVRKMLENYWAKKGTRSTGPR